MINSSEIWKPVKGLENLYEVSNLGRVRRGVRLKKLQEDKSGYMVVDLYRCGKRYPCKVHRLVAEAFLDNPLNKATVNHIDGNKGNNNVENLEWATHSENLYHAYSHGLKPFTERQRIASSKTGKKTCGINRKRVKVFCVKDGERLEFESAHDGARYFNGSASPIIACCKGKKRTYKGAEWGYVCQ